MLDIGLECREVSYLFNYLLTFQQFFYTVLRTKSRYIRWMDLEFENLLIWAVRRANNDRVNNQQTRPNNHLDQVLDNGICKQIEFIYLYFYLFISLIIQQELTNQYYERFCNVDRNRQSKTLLGQAMKITSSEIGTTSIVNKAPSNMAVLKVSERKRNLEQGTQFNMNK